jgi:hypothetical protein
VVTVDVDIWVMFCATLVVLVVDFIVVEVAFVEIPGVTILDVAMGFMVVDILLLETNGAEVDGFTVLLGSLVRLEDKWWVVVSVRM